MSCLGGSSGLVTGAGVELGRGNEVQLLPTGGQWLWALALGLAGETSWSAYPLAFSSFVWNVG